MMGRQFHIRVYGQPRKNPDPAPLAQVVILLGRHLHHQQQRQQQRRQRGGSVIGHTGAGEAGESPEHQGQPGAYQPESSGEDTPPRDSTSDDTTGRGSS